MVNYPYICDEFSLHYFGEICVLRDRKNKVLYLDETQTDIFELCNGVNSTEDIKSKIFQLYDVTCEHANDAEKIIDEFLLNFQSKGILKINEAPEEVEIKSTGIRNIYYPRCIVMELTNSCNLKCAHCFKNASSENRAFLDEKHIDYLINTVKDKTFEIQLTGGEPLLHPNIDNILKKLVDRYYVTITTNGVLLEKIDVELLKKVGFIQVSMYGYDSEKYEEITGSSKAFLKFKQTISLINELEIDNIVTVTLNKNLIDKMEDYVQVINDLGGKAIKFGLPSLVGRANQSSEWNLSTEDEEQIYNNLLYLNKKYADKVHVVVWKEFKTYYSKSKKVGFIEQKCKICREDFKCFPCGSGLLNLTISELGQVVFCQMLDYNYFTIGDIKILPHMIQGKHDVDLRKKIDTYKKDKIAKGESEFIKICSEL